jgi:cytochrome c-type biogenesis protein CcmH/NrfG
LILHQPENANLYDCLGDAYRAMEDSDNAAKAYRQALTVNPNFKYSIEKLKEIENN